VVGRELATLDELSKMQKGNCVLFISTVGAFYSKLYDLKQHPNYNDLYEPWSGNTDKLYNHKRELEYQENSNYKLLFDSGLSFARIIDNLKIEGVEKDELKELMKSGVIQFEDLTNN